MSGKRCQDRGVETEDQGQRCLDKSIKTEVTIHRSQDRGVRTEVSREKFQDRVVETEVSEVSTHGRHDLGEGEVEPLPDPGLLPQLPPEATYL